MGKYRRLQVILPVTLSCSESGTTIRSRSLCPKSLPHVPCPICQVRLPLWKARSYWQESWGMETHSTERKYSPKRLSTAEQEIPRPSSSPIMTENLPGGGSDTGPWVNCRTSVSSRYMKSVMNAMRFTSQYWNSTSRTDGTSKDQNGSFKMMIDFSLYMC